MAGVNRLINSENTIKGNNINTLKSKLTSNPNSTAAAIDCIPCKTEYKTSNVSVLRNTKKK